MRTLLTGVAGTLVFVALSVPSALAQDRGGSGGGGTHTAGGSGHGGGGGASGGASTGSGSASGGGFSGGSSSGGGFSSGGGVSSGGSSGGGFSAGGGGGARGRGAGPSPVGMAAGPRNMGNDRSGGPDRVGGAVAREGSRLIGSDSRDPSIPAGSRPNYGNPVVGSAVPRGTARPSGGGGTAGYPSGYWYNNPYWADWYNLNYGSGYFLRGGPWGYASDGFASRYYSPWARCGYYYPCDPFLLYGYGAWDLGSSLYDPFWLGGMSGYGGGGYSSGGYSSDRSSRDSSRASGPLGGLKLKVSPSIAEVYVDGYYIGRVDDYNGAFQRLELPAGKHRLELRAKGYQAVSFEVDIAARDLIAYRGTMQPLQPGK